MSLIMGKTRFLFEADDDTPDEGFSSGGIEEPAEDNAGEETSTDNNEDNSSEEPAEEENSEEGGEEGSDDTSEDDFTIDSDMDEGTDDSGEDGDDIGSDDSGSDSSSDSSSDEVTVSNSKLKETEKELFDSLSPEEQKIKTKELKNLYMELYTNCNNIIEKLNSVSVEFDDVNIQFKKVINVLFETKRMISDYLLNIFDSKSYIENDIMFNNYLRVFNSVKNITNDIKNMYKDDNEGK